MRRKKGNSGRNIKKKNSRRGEKIYLSIASYFIHLKSNSVNRRWILHIMACVLVGVCLVRRDLCAWSEYGFVAASGRLMGASGAAPGVRTRYPELSWDLHVTPRRNTVNHVCVDTAFTITQSNQIFFVFIYVRDNQDYCLLINTWPCLYHCRTHFSVVNLRATCYTISWSGRVHSFYPRDKKCKFIT